MLINLTCVSIVIWLHRKRLKSVLSNMESAYKLSVNPSNSFPVRKSATISKTEGTYILILPNSYLQDQNIDFVFSLLFNILQ